MTPSEALQHLNNGGRVRAENASEFFMMYHGEVICELKQDTACAATVIRHLTPPQFESEGFGITFETYDRQRKT